MKRASGVLGVEGWWTMEISKQISSIFIPSFRGNIKQIIYPAFAEKKLDGEANILYINWNTDKAMLLNKYGTARKGIWVDNICPTDKKVSIMGELVYDYGYANDLYKLLSAKDNEDHLHFRAYDLLWYDNESVITNPLIDRKEMLLNLPFNDNHLVIPCEYVENYEEMMDYYARIKKEGYEGIVVKNINGSLPSSGAVDWVKIKVKDRSEFEIVGIDPVKERVEIKVDSPKGNKINGLKVCNKDKTALKIGDRVEVEYQGILDGGGLRHPVFIKKV
jgi:hypothetical protein